MNIRDWQDILEDVVDRSVDPEGWRAVAGDRARGVGEDMYLGHPSVGLYQIKTYAKNPFDVDGVGARIARSIDDEIDPILPDHDGTGRFAVRTPPEDEDDAERMAGRVEEVIRTHADAPTTPDALFDDVMEALDSPAFGPIEYDGYGRPDELDDFATTFEEAEEVLETEFEELVEDAGVDRGFQ